MSLHWLMEGGDKLPNTAVLGHQEAWGRFVAA